jgi:hypothetical protein
VQNPGLVESLVSTNPVGGLRYVPINHSYRYILQCSLVIFPCLSLFYGIQEVTMRVFAREYNFLARK